MLRYSVAVYKGNILIQYYELNSITKVARFIETYIEPEKYEIWFDITDRIKEKSISAKELMKIWRS